MQEPKTADSWGPADDCCASVWVDNCGLPTANLDHFLLPRNFSNETEQFHLCHRLPQESLQKLRTRHAVEEQQKQTSTSVQCSHSKKRQRDCLPGATKFDLGDVDSYFACVSAEMDVTPENQNGVRRKESSSDAPLDTDPTFSHDVPQVDEAEGANLGGQVDGAASLDSACLNGSLPVDSASSESDCLLKPDLSALSQEKTGEIDGDPSLVEEDSPVVVLLEANMPSSDSNSTLFEDFEFDFLKAEPVRRSTSLKTYKTPPGTPHKKKGVRFADALGLDLESVRHILNRDEPPVVPISAMRDLQIGMEEEHRTEGSKYLAACFTQPGSERNFMSRIDEGKVVLDNCIVDDKDMTISGTIRVANIGFHKKVTVRYTINNWLTFEDICACYIQNSNDGPTDRFSFTIIVPQYFSVGSRLQFALMYSTNGSNYWDNNYGHNYNVECYAKAVPMNPSDNSWIHFL